MYRCCCQPQWRSHTAEGAALIARCTWRGRAEIEKDTTASSHCKRNKSKERREDRDGIGTKMKEKGWNQGPAQYVLLPLSVFIHLFLPTSPSPPCFIFIFQRASEPADAQREQRNTIIILFVLYNYFYIYNLYTSTYYLPMYCVY